MAIHPSALIRQSEIDEAVRRAEAALAPDVVRIRYSLDEDWSGDPAIYFLVVLSDDAAREERLLEVSRRASDRLREEVRPGELGVLAYFHFESASEQVQPKKARRSS